MNRKETILIWNFIFLFVDSFLFLIINYDDPGSFRMTLFGAAIRAFIILSYITLISYTIVTLFKWLSVFNTLLVAYSLTYFLCWITAGWIRAGDASIWARIFHLITDFSAHKSLSLSYLLALLFILISFKYHFRKSSKPTNLS